MAIALVGQAGVAGVNVAAPGPTVSYASMAGNTLIAAGFVFTGATPLTGITSITDTAGNTWHFSTVNANNPPSAAEGISGSFICCFVGYCIGAAAVTSVTIHDSTGNTDFWRLAVAEFSGIGSADTGAAASAASGQPTVTLTLASAGDLMIGAANSSIAAMNALPAGWTLLSSSGAGTFNIGYDLPGTAGSQSPLWTSGDATKDWAAAVMAFSPGSPLSIGGDDVPWHLRNRR